jgi:hypothetical protein
MDRCRIGLYRDRGSLAAGTLDKRANRVRRLGTDA